MTCPDEEGTERFFLTGTPPTVTSYMTCPDEEGTERIDFAGAGDFIDEVT